MPSFEDYKGRVNEVRRRNKYKGGPRPEVFISIDRKWLCDYFSITRMTLYEWINNNLFNPKDLNSIVQYKQSRQEKLNEIK
jgi:hypothetical protein